MKKVKLSFSVTIEAQTKRYEIMKLANSCWGTLTENTKEKLTFKFNCKEGLDAFVDGLETIK